MKTRTRYALLGLIAGSALMWGGSVTIPNTFTANTTAKASEVNANFSAVKTAVDGNANDIATNEHDINTNTSDIASAVKNIAVGRGLVASRSNGDVTIKKANGYVAVHGSAFGSFSEEGNRCIIYRSWLGSAIYGIFFGNNSTESFCSAFASVNIPNGATVKKLTCRVKHNVSGDLHVRLYMQNRKYVLGSFPQIKDIQKTLLVDATILAGNTSAHTQEVSGTYTPPGGAIILNPTYKSYFIEWDPPQTDSAGSNEALFDCKVDYEY